ncbi:MAG: LytTR family transcriptional regulator [Clostridiales Family XIII bacterium]|jgi:DNA-binding LytR/AlgR family response regulator|nr:LytTR family transcriptional regulator [Clostridiales Family XIII bacterium]
MSKTIPVFTRNEICVIKEEDIVYAKNQMRTVIIHTRDRNYRYYGKLSELAEQLGEMFYICHSNVLVNFERIIRMKDNVVTMDDGEVILLGKNTYQAAKRRFMQYLTSKIRKKD